MNSVTAYNVNDADAAEQRVLEQLSLVKRIALHLKGSLPAQFETDDLIQSGMIGLLAAARDYSPDHGASFATYAGIRIRGAILDEVRQINWSPRSVQKKAQQLSRAEREVVARLGPDATDKDFADELGISLTDYHEMVRDVASSSLMYLEDVEVDPAMNEPNPAEAVIENGMKEAVIDCIDELPEREKLFMSLYYTEELNLKEIGAVLGVSESRACQIHTQALKRIRGKMQTWNNEDGSRF